jgi:hypothetical protein
MYARRKESKDGLDDNSKKDISKRNFFKVCAKALVKVDKK